MMLPFGPRRQFYDFHGFIVSVLLFSIESHRALCYVFHSSENVLCACLRESRIIGKVQFEMFAQASQTMTS